MARQLIVPWGLSGFWEISFLGGATQSSLSLNSSFHCSHRWRDFSVNKSSLWKPWARANRKAPSPTRKTRFVLSITSRASREGFRIYLKAPTAPAAPVGPYMTEASNSTSPSALGSPPYPTPSSSGSSSTNTTPSTTASKVLPPALRIAMAFSTALIPLPLEITKSWLGPCGALCDCPIISSSSKLEIELAKVEESRNLREIVAPIRLPLSQSKLALYVSVLCDHNHVLGIAAALDRHDDDPSRGAFVLRRGH